MMSLKRHELGRLVGIHSAEGVHEKVSRYYDVSLVTFRMLRVAHSQTELW